MQGRKRTTHSGVHKEEAEVSDADRRATHAEIIMTPFSVSGGRSILTLTPRRQIRRIGRTDLKAIELGSNHAQFFENCR